MTRSLYILDEPTFGLHFEDVRKLLEACPERSRRVLHALVEQGTTVVVAAGGTVRRNEQERHAGGMPQPRNRSSTRLGREVIKTADWVIDLGPEGGDKGGEIVAEGTPEDVAQVARSYTGGYLKPLLEGQRVAAE